MIGVVIKEYENDAALHRGLQRGHINGASRFYISQMKSVYLPST